MHSNHTLVKTECNAQAINMVHQASVGVNLYIFQNLVFIHQLNFFCRLKSLFLPITNYALNISDRRLHQFELIYETILPACTGSSLVYRIIP